MSDSARRPISVICSTLGDVEVAFDARWAVASRGDSSLLSGGTSLFIDMVRLLGLAEDHMEGKSRGMIMVNLPLWGEAMVMVGPETREGWIERSQRVDVPGDLARRAADQRWRGVLIDGERPGLLIDPEVWFVHEKQERPPSSDSGYRLLMSDSRTGVEDVL